VSGQVNPEGKYVVDIDKTIDILDIKPNLRVALRNDSYVLHKVVGVRRIFFLIYFVTV
jgi:26S proteasome regulatory subunit T6